MRPSWRRRAEAEAGRGVVRDVNFLYLWLILLLVASMAGMSLYYQDTYGELSGQYKAAEKELEENLALVKAQETELRKRIAEARLAKERETVLSSQYEELRAEKESLEEELQAALEELTALRADYLELQDDLEAVEESLTAAQEKISSLESDLDFLSYQLLAKEADIASLKEQLAECAQG